MDFLEKAWEKCIQGHATLLPLASDEERESNDYFAKDILSDYEEVFQSTMDYMADSLATLEKSVSLMQIGSPSASYVPQTSLALSFLPPIPLPPFSGKASKWESYWDTFRALIIDNKELTDFMRMHFLVSSLTGSARAAIDDIPVTAQNFVVAWTELTSWFENKRRMIETHIAELMNLPTVNRESAFELHALRDKAKRAVGALKRLDRSPEDIMNDICVYAVTTKLDPSTQRSWRLSRGAGTLIPTFSGLIQFLSFRAVALDDSPAPRIEQLGRNVKVSNASAVQSNEFASPCYDGSHSLAKCQTFVKKNPNQRIELVKQSKRCFNCLS
ncbi:uncharacterized protein [Cardiocondyla obscurior]|uniref:uncharacterized protein n=1 Tax=Cardiocondyla obscurior TaxID=286306 RepID=UPI0039657CD8